MNEKKKMDVVEKMDGAGRKWWRTLIRTLRRREGDA